MTESFAELLEESLANQKIKPGAIITGTVVDVNSDMVIVNAGRDPGRAIFQRSR